MMSRHLQFSNKRWRVILPYLGSSEFVRMCSSRVTYHYLAKVSNICRLSYAISAGWVGTPWYVLLWGGDKSIKCNLIHPTAFPATQQHIDFILWRYIIQWGASFYDLHPAQLHEGVTSNWWFTSILASFLEYIHETGFTKTAEAKAHSRCWFYFASPQTRRSQLHSFAYFLLSFEEVDLIADSWQSFSSSKSNPH